MKIFNFYDSYGFVIATLVFFIYLIVCFMLFLLAIQAKRKISSYHVNYVSTIDKKMLYLKKANFDYAMKFFDQREYMLCKSLYDKRNDFHPAKEEQNKEQGFGEKHPLFDQNIDPKRLERIHNFKRKVLRNNNLFYTEPCFSEFSDSDDNNGSKDRKKHRRRCRKNSEIDKYLEEPLHQNKGVYMNRLDLSQYNKAYQNRKRDGDITPSKKTNQGYMENNEYEEPLRLYVASMVHEQKSQHREKISIRPKPTEKQNNPFLNEKDVPENGLQDTFKLKSRPVFDSFIPPAPISNNIDGRPPRKTSDLSLTLNLPRKRTNDTQTNAIGLHPSGTSNGFSKLIAEQNGNQGQNGSRPIDPNKIPNRLQDNQNPYSQVIDPQTSGYFGENKNNEIPNKSYLNRDYTLGKNPYGNSKWKFN